MLLVIPTLTSSIFTIWTIVDLVHFFELTFDIAATSARFVLIHKVCILVQCTVRGKCKISKSEKIPSKSTIFRFMTFECYSNIRKSECNIVASSNAYLNKRNRHNNRPVMHYNGYWVAPNRIRIRIWNNFIVNRKVANFKWKHSYG